MKRLKAVLLGAGQRGKDCYAPYAMNFPAELQFVAVAEPDGKRRAEFCREHNISSELSFNSYEALLDKGKVADAALICTQDNMHFEPTLKAMALGYDILLEKPMSNDLGECYSLSKAAESYERSVLICHVLRYTPFFIQLKRLLDDNVIGKIATIQHNENVGFWHQSHSFVRGNWRNSSLSSPMILAKCSHDMDILYWLAGSLCTEISSFGGLAYFREENAPENSADRCFDGCSAEPGCPYSARKIYMGGNNSPQFEILRSVVLGESDSANLSDALKTGPYGRCVFKCDNDVVDHQTVNMQFENGITAAFTMTGFTKECSRTIKIMGSAGEIRGHMERSEIEIHDFNTGNVTTINVSAGGKGHGGGDEGLMSDFVRYVNDGVVTNRLTFAQSSYHSHLMSLSAEHSRLTGKTVNLKEYEKAAMGLSYGS